MTPSEIRAIRASFAKVSRQEAQAGRIFYDRLFLIAPELRPMFKEDIASQAQKLMDTLALTIGQLRHSAMLHSTLKSLGERHAAYGVQPEHYDNVGEALIWPPAEDHCAAPVRSLQRRSLLAAAQ